MVTNVQRWGNSIGLRIPKAHASEIGLVPGTPVEVVVRDGDLIVTPMRRPQVKLEDLLAKVTRRNIHAESDLGGAVGREAW